MPVCGFHRQTICLAVCARSNALRAVCSHVGRNLISYHGLYCLFHLVLRNVVLSSQQEREREALWRLFNQLLFCFVCSLRMVFLLTYARSCEQSIVVPFCLQPHKCVTLVCVRIQHGCKCCFLFSCCVLQIFKLGIVFLLSQKCVTLVLFQFNMVLPLSFLLMVHLLAS